MILFIKKDFSLHLITIIKNISRIDYINYLILLYAFLLPLSLDITRTISIILIILWISGKDRFETSIPKPLIIFLAFIGISFISYFWSDSTFQEVFKYIKRYWYFFPAFIIYKYIKKAYIEYAISTFLLGMFVSEMISFSIYFHIISPFGLANATTLSPFMQHTMYSIFLAATSIFLLGRFLYEKNIKYQIVYFLFFLSVAVNLFINTGRTGQIAFFGALIILFIYKYKLRIKSVFLSILAIIFILFAAYNFSPNFKNRMNQTEQSVNKMLKKDDYSTSLGIRAAFWIITKEMFLDSPILGVGTANHLSKMKITIEEKLPHLKINKGYLHFHNQYLEVLVQLGIIGLFIFLLFLYSIIKIKILNYEINLLKIGFISVFILGMITDNILWLNMTIMLFSFILGLLLAQNKYEQKRLKEEN